MKKEQMEIGGRSCFIYNYGRDDCVINDAGVNVSGIHGCGAPDNLLIQPVDDHDIEVLDSEAAEIARLAEGVGFTLAAFKVNDWNTDLTPWEAPPVFGNDAFGCGAEATLGYITESLLPELLQGKPAAAGQPANTGQPVKTIEPAVAGQPVNVYLGGYSLAGFFSLWAGYQTDLFAGIAAASPSVWFPGWMDFASGRSTQARRVYLSLGDKEERTRNPVMRTVGDNIRKQLELLRADSGCVDCVLEMNPGNHFREPDIRTAKGFAWLLTSGSLEA